MNITYQPKAKWLWFYWHTMPSYLRKRESLIVWAVVTASPCRRYTKPLDRAEMIIQHAFESFQVLSEIHNASIWCTVGVDAQHRTKSPSGELWMIVITFPARLAGCLKAKRGSTFSITQKWLCARAPFPIPLPSYIYGCSYLKLNPLVRSWHTHLVLERLSRMRTS